MRFAIHLLTVAVVFIFAWSPLFILGAVAGHGAGFDALIGALS